MNLIINNNIDVMADFLIRRIQVDRDSISSKNEIETLLRELPIIEKEQLLSYVENNKSIILEESVLFSETSGTTNIPLQTPRNTYDFSWNTLNQLFAYKQVVQPGYDRVAILHPSVLSPFIEASVKALQTLGVGYVRVFPIEGICSYERLISALKKYKITTIMSTPSLIYKLLYEIELRGELSNLALNKYLLTGEYISTHNIENLKKITGLRSIVRAFVYGSSEAATLMYGCGDHRYKGIYEDFIYELDGIDNNEYSSFNCQNVKHGRLIVTWLRKGMLPIIRYNTNDLFRVEKKDGDYFFTPLGRISNSKLSIIEKNKIDELIYSSGHPVYNYCFYIKNDLSARLEIISKKDLKHVDFSDLIRKINTNLVENYQIEVVLNPIDNGFYDFSPKPKLDKFKYI